MAAVDVHSPTAPLIGGMASGARKPGGKNLIRSDTITEHGLLGLTLFCFQAEDGIRDYKVTGVQTCALPICPAGIDLSAFALVRALHGSARDVEGPVLYAHVAGQTTLAIADGTAVRFTRISSAGLDRKSTRLNSSHLVISYALFSLKTHTIPS